jgi:hypothetical protein
LQHDHLRRKIIKIKNDYIRKPILSLSGQGAMRGTSESIRRWLMHDDHLRRKIVIIKNGYIRKPSTY